MPKRRDIVARLRPATRAVVEWLEKRTLLDGVDISTDVGGSSFYIVRNGATVEIFQNQPLTSPPVTSFVANDGNTNGDNNIEIDDGNGNNTITLDYSGGDPLEGGTLVVGAVGTNAVTADTVNVVGTGGANFGLSCARQFGEAVFDISVAAPTSSYCDQLSYRIQPSLPGSPSVIAPNLNLIDPGTTNQIAVASGSFSFSSNLGVGGALTSLTVGNSASVAFGVTQNLASLNIQSGGSVTMLPAGQQVLDTTSLTVAGSLDLTDNDLIVQSPGATASTLENDIATGDKATLAHQALPVANSIGSSTAQGDGLFVGYAPESAVELGSLDGQTISSLNSLLARSTYQADFNLDGTVDNQDLAILTANSGRNLGATPPEWYEGDANLDGTVNSADCVVLNTFFGAEQFGPPTVVQVNRSYPLDLPLTVSGQTVIRWDVDWGDGDVDSYDPSQLQYPSHDYLQQSNPEIQMSALLADGSSSIAPAIPLAVEGANALYNWSISANSPGANFQISSDNDGNTVVDEDGQFYGQYATANLASLSITGDPHGALTIDFSNPDPLPVSGITTDSAAVNITGSRGADDLFSTTTAAIFDGAWNTSTSAGGNLIQINLVDAEIRHPSTTTVTFLNAGSGDTVESVSGTVTLAGDTSNGGTGSPNGGPTIIVNSAAAAIFTGTQRLSALDILPSGTARMAPDGTAVLVTNSLDIADPTGTLNGGLLDLTDNDMIVRGGDLSQIANWLANGYDVGAWDALSYGIPGTEPAAINSTVAMNDPDHIEALGYAQVGSDLDDGELALSTFDDQAVSLGDVVVKFTYYGDANLNGALDVADYAVIDTGWNDQLTTWTNGSFSYDGAVSGSDYDLLDNFSEINRSSGLVAASLSLEADQPVSLGSLLPTLLPDDSTPINSWLINWGNGFVHTYPTEAFPATPAAVNPYHDAPGTYLASFVALNSDGDPIYRYPHMTITNLLPDLPSYSQPASHPALPAGADTFSPPVGTNFTPASSTTPTIVANNLDGQPDDTLTFTGANFTSYPSTTNAFSDTQFFVYGQTTATNGTFSDAAIQDPTTNGVLATIPASEPGGSMYFVWPVNANGVGSPVAINQTDAQWMEPVSSTASPLPTGSIVSVYGRNLDNSLGQSWIYLQPNGTNATGTWIYIPPSPTITDITRVDWVGDANPYRARFKIPTNVASGTYQVWVYNGLGGVYGWSEVPGETLTVGVASGWNSASPQVVVQNTSQYDDGPAIQEAISQLKQDEAYTGLPGILNFPSGTYHINNDQTQYLVTQFTSQGCFNLSYGGYTTPLISAGLAAFTGPNAGYDASYIETQLSGIVQDVYSNATVTVSLPDENTPYGASFAVTISVGSGVALPVTINGMNLVGLNGSPPIAAVWGSDQLVIPNGTEVLGAGMNSTIISFDGNLPNDAADGSAGFDIGVDDANNRSIELKGMELDYNGPTSSQDGSVVRERSATDVTLDDVEINADGLQAVDWENSNGVTLTNSIIISSNTFINYCSNVVLDEDWFWQDGAAEKAAVSIFGGSFISMADCTTENYLDDLPGGGASIPDSQKRFYAGEGKFVEFAYNVSDVYCADNTSINLGEYQPPADPNSGEQILVDAENPPLVDEAITSAGTDTVTIPGSFPQAASGYYLDITGGRGLGQRLYITGVSQQGATTTLTLSGNFTEEPVGGDYVCVEQAPSNVVIYQNDLSHTTNAFAYVDFSSTGIAVNSGHGIVIDGNTINNTLNGIRLVSSYTPDYSNITYALAPFSSAEVADNNVNVIMTGAEDDSPPLVPTGVQIGFGGFGEEDANYYGLVLRSNVVNVELNASGGSTSTLGIGLSMLDYTNGATPVPNEFGAFEYNTVTNFTTAFIASDTPDTLVDNNTFMLGNGVQSGSSGISFSSAKSLLLFGNSYAGFQSNYQSPPADSTLSLPQSVFYLTSGGSDSVASATLNDAGAAPLTWSVANISGLPSWLTIQNTSGTIFSEQSCDLTFVADPTGQSAGNLAPATITINFDNGLSRTIIIHFIVN